MKEPTKEQLERAYEAYRRKLTSSEDVTVKECLLAAAPHLQVPIEEPSEEDVKEACKEWKQCINWEVGIEYALRSLVRRRNAAMQAQPEQQSDVAKKTPSKQKSNVAKNISVLRQIAEYLPCADAGQIALWRALHNISDALESISSTRE